jgi:hypothetical protein
MGPVHWLSLIVMGGGHGEAVDRLRWGKQTPIPGISGNGFQGSLLYVFERLIGDFAPRLITVTLDAAGGSLPSPSRMRTTARWMRSTIKA